MQRYISFLAIFLLPVIMLVDCKGGNGRNTLSPLPFDCEGLPDPASLCNAPDIPDGKSTDEDFTLTACGQAIDKPGTYLLANSVDAQGPCFEITSDNVTLDLGGNTITHGRRGGTSDVGIKVNRSSEIEIRNGTVEEISTQNLRSHPIIVEGSTDVTIRNIHAIARGEDSYSMMLAYSHGYAKVYNNHLTNLSLKTTSRHYPGQIVIWAAGGDGDIEIYENYIDAGSQWGIKVSGDDFNSAKVYKNCIEKMKSIYANAYAIGAYAAGLEVYQNYINTESRGIHMGNDQMKIHDNYVEAWEAPNSEYPDRYWVHAIKLEGCTNSHLYCNKVLAKADSEHSDGHGLNLTVDASSNNMIYNNEFQAQSYDTVNKSYALYLVGVPSGSGTSMFENIFKSDTRIFHVDWGGAHGLTLERNIFEKTGEREDFYTVDYFTNPDSDSLNNTFVDTELIGGASLRDIRKGGGETISYTVKYNATVVVKDSGGGPIEGASVTIKDKNGSTVGSGNTDAQGKVTVLITDFEVNGPGGVYEAGQPKLEFTDYNDHTVSVDAGSKGSASVTEKIDSTDEIVVSVD